MIRQLFDQCGIFTNDYALNVITLHLIIMIDRIRGGHSLEDSVDLNKIAELPGYSVALKIANYLQQEFGKELNEAELYHLTLVIVNNTTQLDPAKINAGKMCIRDRFFNLSKENSFQRRKLEFEAE